MASEEKSFADLVKAAPAAPAAGTASLVGTLSQSSEAGKFVLTTQDGSALTLETAAVKGHSVLGTSVGQTVVRVDVDSAKLPARLSQPQPVPLSTALTNPDVDHPFTVPVRDYTVAWLDHGTPYWLDHTVPYLDFLQPGTGFADPIGPNTLAEGNPDPYGGLGGPVQAGGVAPFALATPHQAPPGTLAAVQGYGLPSGTHFWWDPPIKPPHADNPKIIADSGATGRWPWWD